MQKIGSITIDDTYYPGKDLYSDGEIEDEMLDIAKNVPVSEYNRVIAERKSWAILYHFSNVRENIVQSMPITKEDSVLEIGAGCGAITGVLARMAKNVDAVELSMKRSLINAYRHQEADNITIKVGNFQEVEQHLEQKYDVITLIGVFEYACSYIDSEQPYAEFLEIIKKHLTKDGRLILAIENKFGLKYWAGSREDHTGKFFDGLEGYIDTDSKVRTFSKEALKKIITDAGYAKAEFYYPFPDYKFPVQIFSDEYLPREDDLNIGLDTFDNTRMMLFNENRVYANLLKEKKFDFFANSFFIEVTK